MPQGFFITFEGLDGSGKSTQLRRLAQWFEAKQLRPLTTRQPGGTAIGDRIRAVLLDSRTDNSDDALVPFAELGLMFADRAQTLAHVIRPALDGGRVVLCDRFTDSTEAYQGGGRRLGAEIVRDLHRCFCGGLQPDLTLLLQPDFETSLKRARRRNSRALEVTGEDENRFETFDTGFFRRVFDQYNSIASRDPLRVVVIDDNAGIDAIHARIVSVVEERLPSHLRS